MMRIDARKAISGLFIAGVSGALLFLPTISFIGTMLLPSQPARSTTHVPAVLADAIWARALGGRATQLEPLNPFTIGRVVSCHVLAERHEDQTQRNKEHDECMALLPGVQGIGYLSSVHMRSEGVWQDPRVPFVQIAQMSKMSSTWTKEELIDTLAARGEFGFGFVGAGQAARGYFGKAVGDVTLPQAALLAAALGDGNFGSRRSDPWCNPTFAASLRRRILDRMKDSQAIDEAAYESTNRAELGLTTPPADHKGCTD